MSNLINFNFENHQVRTAIKNGSEPYFCLSDVAEILEIQNNRQSRFNLDEKGVEKVAIQTKGGKQEATFINEPNLYRVIFRSNKAEAVKFQNWVFDEVLPSIRKTGQYRHTISETQAHAISKAVKQKCQHNSTHYQTLYHALYDEFGITSYKELLASDFERAMAFIVGYEFAPALNVAFIQNILADTAYQTKKAQHEIDGIAHVIKGLLHHIEDVQNRLNHSERCVLALQQRFIVS